MWESSRLVVLKCGLLCSVFVCVWIPKRKWGFIEVCSCECVIVWLCQCYAVCACSWCSAHLKRLITLFSLAETDRSSFSVKVPVHFSWTLDYPAHSNRVYWSCQPKWSYHLFMRRTKALPGAGFWQTVSISIAATTVYPASQCLTERDLRKDWRDSPLLKYCSAAHWKYSATGFHENMMQWCIVICF